MEKSNAKWYNVVEDRNLDRLYHFAMCDGIDSVSWIYHGGLLIVTPFYRVGNLFNAKKWILT